MHLAKDSAGSLAINLMGTNEEKGMLDKIYYSGWASSERQLILDICDASDGCIKCKESGNIFRITKTGSITLTCKNQDGEAVYCCS